MNAQDGVWWPAGTDDRVAGRLDPSGDPLTLRLNGAFKSRTFMDMSDIAIVHGFVGSRRVTVQRCTPTATSIGTGVPSQEFLVGAIWFDVHTTDFAVTALALELEHLQEWSGLRRPTVERAPEDSLRSVARHLGVTECSARVPGASIKVVAGHSISVERTSVTLGTRMRFEIDLTGSLVFDDAEDRYVRPLRNLITLAAARPVGITSLTAQLPADDGGREPHIATILQNWIVKPQEEARALHAEELTFTMQTLASDLDAAMNVWLRANTDHRSAFNLFFGNYEAPPRFIETRFLVYAQALEVFHRSRIGGFRLAPEEHERRVAGVLEQVAPTHRDWVRVAIVSSHNKSLADRSRELAEVLPPELEAIIGPPVDFARDVSRLRNDLVHAGRSSKSVDAYFVLTNKLRLLLHFWFMKELRLPDETIVASLEGSRLLREVEYIVRTYGEPASPG